MVPLLDVVPVSGSRQRSMASAVPIAEHVSAPIGVRPSRAGSVRTASLAVGIVAYAKGRHA